MKFFVKFFPFFLVVMIAKKRLERFKMGKDMVFTIPFKDIYIGWKDNHPRD
jgi:hypothetical protein